ncbi:MAG: homoserine kinase [Polyangiaceae bacterium]
MALLTPMTLDEARAIGSSYAVTVTSFEALAAGSVNSNFRLETEERGRLFVRVYEEQGDEGARAELGLVRELSALGVPTPLPLARPDGAVTAEHRGRPVGVYPWVDGEILCQARVDVDAVGKLGVALGRLHLASTKVSRVPAGRFDVRSLLGRLDRVEATSETYAPEARRIRAKLQSYLARAAGDLPRGLIHGDLFKDNVLWQGQEIAALIDFESASAGVFAYDLMVCVHAWCYADAFRPELVRALLAGYASVRPLTRQEARGLVDQGALAALRFATTRITDYSLRAAPGQPPVRDYKRFLARLDALEAGILEPALAAIG